MNSTDASFDIKTVMDRAKHIVLNPVTGWGEVKSYNYDFKGVVLQYFAIISLIPAICMFFKSWLFGLGGGIFVIKFTLAQSLQMGITMYIQSLLSIVVGAHVLEFVIPKLGGSITKIDAAKYIAFASTAGSLAGIGYVIPYLGWLLLLAGGILAIYTSYQGFCPMTGVPETKRLVSYILSGLAMGITFFVLMLVFNLFAPRPTPDFGGVGKIEIDGKELNETMKSLQDFSKGFGK